MPVNTVGGDMKNAKAEGAEEDTGKREKEK